MTGLVNEKDRRSVLPNREILDQSRAFLTIVASIFDSGMKACK